MSFTTNPYTHIEIIEDPDTFMLQWKCNGCGGESKTRFPVTTSVLMIIKDFHAHVKNSHKLTPADVKKWS